MKAGNFAAATHADNSIDWNGKPNLILVEKRPDAAEGDKLKPKVWIEFLSESDVCKSVGHLGWTETAAGIRIENGYRSLQVKIGHCWCPTDAGIESVIVPPKGHIRTWVQPTVAHTLDDLKRRVKVEGQIGTVRLRVDGCELDISV